MQSDNRSTDRLSNRRRIVVTVVIILALLIVVWLAYVLISSLLDGQQPLPTEIAVETTGPPATVPATGSPTPSPLPASTDTPPPPPTPELGTSNIYIEFILDASGSMNETLPDGALKLEVAKNLLTDHLGAYGPETNIGLRAYGHRVSYRQTEESCRDIELNAPVEKGQLETMVTWLRGFAAQGMTPLAESIRQAMGDFVFEPARTNSIVMLSDGIETCEGDPCGLVEELKVEGINFTIHVIGLDVDEATRQQLRCIADTGGGTYHDVETEQDLEDALDDIQGIVTEDEVIVPPGMDTPTPLPASTATPLPPTPTWTPSATPVPPTPTPSPSATATHTATAAPTPAGPRRIAFVSHRDGNDEIYLMYPDGTNLQRLTNTPDIQVWHPSWSPDGSRIVFQCYRYGGSGFNVCLINSDGSGYTEITDWEQDGSGAQRHVWSPDGNQIAVSREMGSEPTAIWLMNADGSNQRQLVEGRDPSWSPDGRSIAFQWAADGGAYQQVWTVRTDGSNLQQLTNIDSFVMYPAWSPDGRQIAFEVGMSYIAVIGADGGAPRTVVNKRSWNLSWSPDGTQLVIAPVQEGIWVVNLDGSGLHQIAREGTQPSWQH